MMPYCLIESHASMTAGDGGPLKGDLCQREPLKRVSTNGTDASSSLMGAIEGDVLAVTCAQEKTIHGISYNGN